MKKITLEEKHQIQIEMLKEIDTICSENGIRYSLAFGTLIGAIRHQGFIPWDDDMDIMMPVTDMLRFKKILNSKTLRYVDIDTNSNYQYPFSRIYNSKTFSAIKFNHKDIGINIDLYPIVDIPKSEEFQCVFFKKALKLQNIRLSLMRWNSKITYRIPIKKIPFLYHYVKKYHDFLMQDYTYGKTGSFFIICMDILKRKKVIYNMDLFDKVITVNFEGLKVKAIGHYDFYLKQMYGDYMQLPPENQRVPYHGGDYYWK